MTVIRCGKDGCVQFDETGAVPKRHTAYVTCRGCDGRFVFDTHRTKRKCPRCKLSWVGMHSIPEVDARLAKRTVSK